MDDTDFIGWFFRPEINQERTSMVEDSLHFIREGLREESGPPKPSAIYPAFEAVCKAAMYDHLNAPFVIKKGKTPRMDYRDAGDSMLVFAAAFLDEHQWSNSGGPIAAWRCGPFSDELQQRLNSFWHPTIDEEHTSTRVAFEVVYSNLARANTRITLLSTLRRLLKLREPVNFMEIRTELWMRKVQFQRELMVLGALGGEELLRTAVVTVAPQTIISGDRITKYSLIQLVQRDGYMPGRWMSVTEDGLRDDLETSFKRLTGDAA